MAALRWLVAMLIPVAVCGCQAVTHDPVDFDPGENGDFRDGCTSLCCKERGAKCDGGNGTCEQCADRCAKACASARPLVYCLDQRAEIRLVCAPDGSVVAETDACATELDAYQAATRACGQPSAAVGGQ